MAVPSPQTYKLDARFYAETIDPPCLRSVVERAQVFQFVLASYYTMTVWWLLHWTPFGTTYRDALRHAKKEVGRGRKNQVPHSHLALWINQKGSKVEAKEVTDEAALPLADLVTRVGNNATFADCEKEIALLREFSPKVDLLPDLRMLEIKTNGLIDILPFQVEEFNNRTTYFVLTCEEHQRTYCGVRERFRHHSTLRVLVGNSRNQANHTSKAAAMDNEEDKEEEQTEILAEDDFEGEQSEEEPSPVPTIHRALASRRNTSSPTQHPPQPQTPPQLPLSPLSTPVAPSPIPAFATTPSRAPAVISYLPRTDTPPVPPYLNDALLDAIRPESRTTTVEGWAERGDIAPMTALHIG
ncbi:hypothetical protein BLNAU_22491 [Blattamonas nauphoetae]|uniref:Uncharacterized protein n=1 Tax=Blattamonas nauphoetae TaxID=2049346 RepID=A0ABQ9WV48_9EUKA|nr:hypothetical protein BLNAU_22491 [Blattamonas nauphoetae]